MWPINEHCSLGECFRILHIVCLLSTFCTRLVSCFINQVVPFFHFHYVTHLCLEILRFLIISMLSQLQICFKSYLILWVSCLFILYSNENYRYLFCPSFSFNLWELFPKLNAKFRNQFSKDFSFAFTFVCYFCYVYEFRRLSSNFLRLTDLIVRYLSSYISISLILISKSSSKLYDSTSDCYHQIKIRVHIIIISIINSISP